MAMKETSKQVFEFLRAHDGEDLTLNKIAETLGMAPRTVNGCLVGMQKKKLVIREETTTTGEDGKSAIVKYIRLTDAAYTFDPDATEVKEAK